MSVKVAVWNCNISQVCGLVVPPSTSVQGVCDNCSASNQIHNCHIMSRSNWPLENCLSVIFLKLLFPLLHEDLIKKNAIFILMKSKVLKQDIWKTLHRPPVILFIWSSWYTSDNIWLTSRPASGILLFDLKLLQAKCLIRSCYWSTSETFWGTPIVVYPWFSILLEREMRDEHTNSWTYQEMNIPTQIDCGWW